MAPKPTREELENRIKDLEGIVDKLKNFSKELRRLATVVLDSNDAITVQDFNGNILEWNKGAVKMYGWPEAKARKMNIGEIIPPDRSDEFKTVIERISKGERVESFETKRMTADGRILDIWLTVTALFNEKGTLYALATTERDITERKRTEKEKTEFIKQLQKTHGEVKTLRGIIPICMVCKQIRDDNGYWEQVEVYVHKHSEADFSHGICPNCLKTLYPRIYDKKLLDKPKS